MEPELPGGRAHESEHTGCVSTTRTLVGVKKNRRHTLNVYSAVTFAPLTEGDQDNLVKSIVDEKKHSKHANKRKGDTLCSVAGGLSSIGPGLPGQFHPSSLPPHSQGGYGQYTTHV